MANANQVIINGETILDLRSDTVTPETLQKGYTAHDKSGTKITGTLEASSPVVTKETWIIKDNAPVDETSYELAKTNISFASGGAKFVALEVFTDGIVIWLKYYTTANKVIEVGSFEPGMGEDKFYWPNSAYKKLTFDTPPAGALLSWLQSNATKQTSGVSVQDTKALTITSNGTVSVTPDVPYDALKMVDATVNVASGGEVLNFFGGSKYYITEITPTSDTYQITITPDDTTVLDSPKFLLVTQDIPAARNAVQTRTIARAPSYNYYLSAAIAFSVGQVCTQCIAYVDPYSGIDAASYVYSDVNGGDAFDGSHGITISGGSMTFNTSGAERLFKGGQTYKVLLIG